MFVKMGLFVTQGVCIVMVDVTTITLHNFPGVNHEAEKNTVEEGKRTIGWGYSVSIDIVN